MKVRITFVRAGSIGLLSLFILQIHEASYLFLKSITLLRTLLRSSVRTKYIQEMPLTPPGIERNVSRVQSALSGVRRMRGGRSARKKEDRHHQIIIIDSRGQSQHSTRFPCYPLTTRRCQDRTPRSLPSGQGCGGGRRQHCSSRPCPASPSRRVPRGCRCIPRQSAIRRPSR